MRNQAVSLIFVLLVGTLMWGCGSNLDSDSGSKTGVTNLADAARSENCTVCHTVGVHAQVSGIAGQP